MHHTTHRRHTARMPTMPNPLLIALLTLTLTLLATLHTCTATRPDMTCVDACSDWSITMGHCRGTYGFAREFSLIPFSYQLGRGGKRQESERISA